MAPTDQHGAIGTGPHAAALHVGPGHVVMYASPAFLGLFGAGSVGLPAREAMVGLPAAGFAVMDRVRSEGRALARRVRIEGHDLRLVVAPRRDPETGEVYGITSHLVPPGWGPPTPGS
jgi:hypothetical protein